MRSNQLKRKEMGLFGIKAIEPLGQECYPVISDVSPIGSERR
jgi:hypothetical protein